MVEDFGKPDEAFIAPCSILELTNYTELGTVRRRLNKLVDDGLLDIHGTLASNPDGEVGSIFQPISTIESWSKLSMNEVGVRSEFSSTLCAFGIIWGVEPTPRVRSDVSLDPGTFPSISTLFGRNEKLAA